MEIARDWLRRNDLQFPKKTLAEVAADCLKAQASDGKSKERCRRLGFVFNNSLMI
ncbi:MAG: hypothetical protein WDM76_16795 [Limisphaerales bacterium]